MIPEILLKLLFAVFSLSVAASDIKTGMVPRIAFILAFPIFLTLNLLQTEGNSSLMVIAGALLGFFVFILAFFISGKRLGLADVWYSTIAGLVLGPWWWYAAMCCACFFGMIYMIVSKRRQIPFIPLMAFGAVAMNLIQG